MPFSFFQDGSTHLMGTTIWVNHQTPPSLEDLDEFGVVFVGLSLPALFKFSTNSRTIALEKTPMINRETRKMTIRKK